MGKILGYSNLDTSKNQDETCFEKKSYDTDSFDRLRKRYLDNANQKDASGKDFEANQLIINQFEDQHNNSASEMPTTSIMPMEFGYDIALS